MSQPATQPATGSAEPELRPEEAAQLRELRVQRNLKILVLGLGLLILVGLGAVIFQVIRSGAQRSVALNAAAPVSGAPVNAAGVPAAVPGPAGGSVADTWSGTGAGNIDLELPQGAHVVSISISGNRLAVHHESAYGTGIAVIDLDTGRRIANVNQREAAPRPSK